MCVAHGAPRFTPRQSWESRTWLWNERLLKKCALDHPYALGLPLLLLIGVPLLLCNLGLFLAYAVVMHFRTPPAPRGPFSVGVHDSARDGVRFRAWYPADPARGGGRAWWLAHPRREYGFAYLRTTGMPRWLAHLISRTFAAVRAPAALLADAAPLRPPTAAARGWPVALFSHGLVGCTSAYSSLCAEVASHGALVVAIEHTDGSAIRTETAGGAVLHFLSKRPTGYADDEAWRAAQQERRTAELLSLLCGLRAALAPTPLASAQYDASRVALLGHSYGGSTALAAAAALLADGGAPVPSAVVLLDPWIAGCAPRLYSAGAYSARGRGCLPVLAVMTQSMMYPENAERLNRVLTAVAGDDGGGAATPVVMAEAAGTRHQEASDFACLAYTQIRTTCMAGALPPAVALRRFCDATVGFLEAVGAQPPTGDPSQARAAALVRGWFAASPSARGGAVGDTPAATDAGFVLHH